MRVLKILKSVSRCEQMRVNTSVTHTLAWPQVSQGGWIFLADVALLSYLTPFCRMDSSDFETGSDNGGQQKGKERVIQHVPAANEDPKRGKKRKPMRGRQTTPKPMCNSILRLLGI